MKVRDDSDRMQIEILDGSEQLHQMIPPYTMPSLVSNICPRAHAVPAGTLEGGGNPVSDRGCYLSVTDVVLDCGLLGERNVG